MPKCLHLDSNPVVRREKAARDKLRLQTEELTPWTKWVDDLAIELRHAKESSLEAKVGDYGAPYGGRGAPRQWTPTYAPSKGGKGKGKGGKDEGKGDSSSKGKGGRGKGTAVAAAARAAEVKRHSPDASSAASPITVGQQL